MRIIFLKLSGEHSAVGYSKYSSYALTSRFENKEKICSYQLFQFSANAL